MNEYADAKGPLIAEITERAETWARTSGLDQPDSRTVIGTGSK
jgi:hypothetical protein